MTDIASGAAKKNAAHSAAEIARNRPGSPTTAAPGDDSRISALCPLQASSNDAVCCSASADPRDHDGLVLTGFELMTFVARPLGAR